MNRTALRKSSLKSNEVAPTVPIFLSGYFFSASAQIYDGILNAMSGRTDANIFSLVGMGDLSEHLKQQKAGLVVGLIHADGDLEKYQKIFHSLPKELVNSGAINFLLITVSSHFHPLTHKNTFDFVPHNINEVLKKIDSAILKIKNLVQHSNDLFNMSVPSEGVRLQNQNFQVNILHSIYSTEDIWLLENKNHIDRKNNHWVIQLMGPSASEGSWVKDSTMINILGLKTHSYYWKWVFSSSTIFSKHQRHLTWVFVGNEPVYRMNRWFFTGFNPELLLCNPKEGISEYRFFATSPKTIAITANSRSALQCLPKIYFSMVKKGGVLDYDKTTNLSSINLDVVNTDYIHPLIFKSTVIKENKKGFNIITDEHYINNVFELGRKKHSKIILYPHKENSNFKAIVTSVDLKNRSFQILRPLVKTSNLRLEEALVLGHREFYFRCFFENEHLFFNAPLLIQEDSELRFALPKKIFEFQRRSKPRLKIPAEWQMDVVLENHKSKECTEFKMLDLSSGGCSLLMSEKDIQNLNKGDQHFSLTFFVESKRIFVQTEIRYIHFKTEFENNSYVKVGFKFLNITLKDVQFLKQFVLQKIIESD